MEGDITNPSAQPNQEQQGSHNGRGSSSRHANFTTVPIGTMRNNPHQAWQEHSFWSGLSSSAGSPADRFYSPFLGVGTSPGVLRPASEVRGRGSWALRSSPYYASYRSRSSPAREFYSHNNRGTSNSAPSTSGAARGSPSSPHYMAPTFSYTAHMTGTTQRRHTASAFPSIYDPHQQQPSRTAREAINTPMATTAATTADSSSQGGQGGNTQKGGTPMQLPPLRKARAASASAAPATPAATAGQHLRLRGPRLAMPAQPSCLEARMTGKGETEVVEDAEQAEKERTKQLMKEQAQRVKDMEKELVRLILPDEDQEDVDKALLLTFPAGKSMYQLPDAIQTLLDGMPRSIAAAPMRLLRIDTVLGWSSIKVYEEVKPKECVDVPYSRVSDQLWAITAVLSWRWGAPKPAKYVVGFSPMAEPQFKEFKVVLQQAKHEGMSFVWVDWSCVPQYSAPSMVEVLRSKAFYARARGLIVIPTFTSMADGFARVVKPLLGKVRRMLLARCQDSFASAADSDSAARSAVAVAGNTAASWSHAAAAAAVLKRMLRREVVGGREYFCRAWTLAERMARYGRSEQLCNWMSLEVWLGMLVDALLRSTEDPAASQIYRKILGRSISEHLQAAVQPLTESLELGSLHTVEGRLEVKLAQLFEEAVGVWSSASCLCEAPTRAWLLEYLLELDTGVYQAWAPSDRLWAVYSYFNWKDADRTEAGLLAALRDLVRIAGGSLEQLATAAVRLGLGELLLESANSAIRQQAEQEARQAELWQQEVENQRLQQVVLNAVEEEAKRKKVQQQEAQKRQRKEDEIMRAFGAKDAKEAKEQTQQAKGAAAAAARSQKQQAGHSRSAMAPGIPKGGGAAVVDMLSQLEPEAKNQKLLEAVEDGDMNKLVALIARGADVNTSLQGGWTPLLLAILQGRTSAVRMLLKAGANKDWPTSGGVTPLILALEENEEKAAKALLEADADTAATNSQGRTALHIAAWKGLLDSVLALIRAGADKEAVDKDGRSPLHLAAERGHAPVVQALLDSGANKDAADAGGSTALQIAAAARHLEAAEALVAAAGGLGGSTDSIIADPATTQILEKLRQDKQAAAVEEERRRQEAAAAESEAQREAKAALAAGAELLSAATAGDVAEVRRLLEDGAVVDARDKDGCTPLGLAATVGVADALLKSAADYEAKDKANRRPDKVAESRGNVEVADTIRRWRKAHNPTALTENDAASLRDMFMVKLKLQPQLCDGDVELLTQRAEGTSWRLREVEGWIRSDQKRRSRVLCIVGDAGEGKSSVAAALVGQGSSVAKHIMGYHFVKANDKRRLDPIEVIHSFAFQVAMKNPDHRRLLIDGPPYNGTVICDISTPVSTAFRSTSLWRMSENGVLLLDGLNEADPPLPPEAAASSSEQQQGASGEGVATSKGSSAGGAVVPTTGGNRILQWLLNELCALGSRIIVTARPDTAFGRLVPALTAKYGRGAVRVMRMQDLRQDDSGDKGGAGRSEGGGALLLYSAIRPVAEKVLQASGRSLTPPSSHLGAPAIADVYGVYDELLCVSWDCAATKGTQRQLGDLLSVVLAAQEPLALGFLQQLGLVEVVPLLPGYGVVAVIQEDRLQVDTSMLEWLAAGPASGVTKQQATPVAGAAAVVVSSAHGHGLIGLELARNWAHAAQEALEALEADSPSGSGLAKTYLLRYLALHLAAAAAGAAARGASVTECGGLQAEAATVLDSLLVDPRFYHEIAKAGQQAQLLAALGNMASGGTSTERSRTVLRWIGTQPDNFRELALRVCSGRFVYRDLQRLPRELFRSSPGIEEHFMRAQGLKWRLEVQLPPPVVAATAADDEKAAVRSSPACVAALKGHCYRLAGYGPSDTQTYGSVFSVAWSPDGKQLLSGGDDRTLRVWDTGSLQCTAVMVGPKGWYDNADLDIREMLAPWMYSAAWSSDGRLLASGCLDYDKQQSRSGRLSFDHSRALNTCAVRLWDAVTGVCVATLKPENGVMDKHGVRSVAWCPDRPLLAAGAGKKVYVWNVSDEGISSAVATLPGNTDFIHCVAWAPGAGDWLASAGADGVVRVWDTSASNLTAAAASSRVTATEMSGHIGAVRSCAWRPSVAGADGTDTATAGASHPFLLASTGEYKELRLWEVPGGRCTAVVPSGHGGTVTSLAWEPNGARLASGSEDKTIRVWSSAGLEVSGWQCLQVLEGHTDAVLSVAWGVNRSAQRLVSGSADRDLRLWDLSPAWSATSADGEKAEAADNMPTTASQSFSVHGAACSQDGRFVAAACSDKVLRVWESSSWSCVAELRTDDAPHSVAWRPTLPGQPPQLASAANRIPGVCFWGSDDDGCTSWHPAGEVGLSADEVTSIAWQPEGGPLLAVAATSWKGGLERENKVYVIDGDKREMAWDWRVQGRWANHGSLVWTPHGDGLLLACNNAKDGSLVQLLACPAAGTGAAVSCLAQLRFHGGAGGDAAKDTDGSVLGALWVPGSDTLVTCHSAPRQQSKEEATLAVWDLSAVSRWDPSWPNTRLTDVWEREQGRLPSLPAGTVWAQPTAAAANATSSAGDNSGGGGGDDGGSELMAAQQAPLLLCEPVTRLPLPLMDEHTSITWWPADGAISGGGGGDSSSSSAGSRRQLLLCTGVEQRVVAKFDLDSKGLVGKPSRLAVEGHESAGVVMALRGSRMAACYGGSLRVFAPIR